MRLLALGDFRFTAAGFSLAPDTRDVTVIVVAVHRVVKLPADIVTARELCELRLIVSTAGTVRAVHASLGSLALGVTAATGTGFTLRAVRV